MSALLWFAISAAALNLLAFTAVTLFQPVLDAHGFRQTQTAINVYSILHEGVLVDYLTPVLGAPWSLPFEAPIYQLVVGFLSAATDLPLDAAGRVVSVTFFLGTLALGFKILVRLLPGDRYAAPLFVFFALISPLYLFWSRTFMMETCAVFFSTAWLFCVLREPNREAVPWFVVSVPLCILASLAKVTTWPAFVCAYALYAGLHLRVSQRLRVWPAVIAWCGIILALGAAFMWTKHTDVVRMLNPFGEALTSASLKGWTFGTWSQLLSAPLWFALIPLRIVPDAIGYGWPVLALFLPHARWRSVRTHLAFAALLLFLLPIAVFTNLHVVHDYYGAANALFAIAVVVFVLSELIAIGRLPVAAVIAFVLVIGCLARFWLHQWPTIARNQFQHPFYITAKLVERSTPPDSALIVLGIDWSSEIHYYARRKGVAFPGWGTPDQAQRLFADPDAFMGGQRTFAVVDCRAGHFRYSTQLDKLMSDFVASWKLRADLISRTNVLGACDVYVRRN